MVPIFCLVMSLSLFNKVHITWLVLNSLESCSASKLAAYSRLVAETTTWTEGSLMLLKKMKLMAIYCEMSHLGHTAACV